MILPGPFNLNVISLSATGTANLFLPATETVITAMSSPSAFIEVL